ncbi:Kinesin-like protein Klp10A [Portunus trituberculatus]|uniref:Kinesin-like protein Klp10A n=1 Tax=Portunus trituberculatus TaxID=210409 RepID=A0A5B7FCL1_PORTR|nr:Kinesin-like protein Klp10A [Portunus trituberculatus]
MLWGLRGLQAHRFESCPRSECSLGFLTQGNGFLTAIPPAARRRSNVVKEVDRIQKKREERRKQQAEKKEEKEALMNLDPGNPQWEFLNMIREFRSQLEFRTLRDGDPLEEHQITVAVRKRPLNKKENGKREVDVITIPKRNTLYVHEPRTKVDLTKYLENQNFRFDYAFDETCNNELVYNAVQLPPISSAGNFIYSRTHIRAHITPQVHLGCNHLEPGYHGDM